jgi:hypothetical protein
MSWLAAAVAAAGAVASAQQPANPRQQPGQPSPSLPPNSMTSTTGTFVSRPAASTWWAALNDAPGWDHMDNARHAVRPAAGTVAIDVDEIKNTGTFTASLKIPEGDLDARHRPLERVQPVPERRHRRLPARARHRLGLRRQQLAEGFVYLAGWGFGHATLNGKPLYQDYEMHFMVTQGMRDRKTLKVNYPMAGKKLPAGEVNPATQQIDFYIRSPKMDPRNTRRVKCSCTSSAWK